MLGRVDRGIAPRLFNFFFQPNAPFLERISRLTVRMIIPGVLLCGVGFALRRYFSYSSPAPKLSSELVRGNLGYSDDARWCIQRVEKLLSENTNVAPYLFVSSKTGVQVHQPMNEKIAKLQTLYNSRYEEICQRLRAGGDPWADGEFQKKIHSCLSIAFVISYWTLDDLPQLTEQSKKTTIECLTMPDSYASQTFFCCPLMYHIIRGKYGPEKPEGGGNFYKTVHDFFLRWTPGKKLPDVVGPQIPLGLYPLQDIPKEYAEKFYSVVGNEVNFRKLYNSYCQWVRKYVTEKELYEASKLHWNWTREDEKNDTFCPPA